MRSLTLFLLTGLVALSFVIYEIKYDTREMEDRVASLRLEIQKERDAIAILRAEWSHLNRPERIERLAKKHLGYAPMQARQMVTPEQFAVLRAEISDEPPPAAALSGLPAARFHHPVHAVQR